MSEWNRTGRDDNQRRYDSNDDGRRSGAQDRWWNRGRDEQRSFDQDGGRESYGDAYRAGQISGRRGYGGQGGASYGGDRDLGERYGQGRYAGQGYGYGERPYRQQPTGYREYGPRQEPPFAARNDLVEQVSDGDGEHRGRGPKNYTRSDARIAEDVNDRLTDDPRLDASEIDVRVEGGEITLTGTVTSRDDKRRAEDVAEQVSGVKHVQNNLRVQSASSMAAAAQTSQSGGPSGHDGHSSSGRHS